MAKNKIELDHHKIIYWTEKLANRIVDSLGLVDCDIVQCYPVKRGGYCVFLYLAAEMERRGIHLQPVDAPELSAFILDDIVDSGNTRRRYLEYGPFFALLEEGVIQKEYHADWAVFPWEQLSGESEGPTENITRLIEFIGDNPNREGLLETPDRVIKSYSEIYSGYQQDPQEIMKTFECGSMKEMVVLTGIEFFSNCEHHMQPFYGTAHIGYIPDGRVLGISKLARLLEIYSRRLQIQERIGTQVTSALMQHLKPLGAACVLEAKHFCMTCRGVNKQNSIMKTASLEGVFKSDAMVRSEFYSMIKS